MLIYIGIMVLCFAATWWSIRSLLKNKNKFSDSLYYVYIGLIFFLALCFWGYDLPYFINGGIANTIHIRKIEEIGGNRASYLGYLLEDESRNTYWVGMGVKSIRIYENVEKNRYNIKYLPKTRIVIKIEKNSESYYMYWWDLLYIIPLMVFGYAVNKGINYITQYER